MVYTIEASVKIIWGDGKKSVGTGGGVCWSCRWVSRLSECQDSRGSQFLIADEEKQKLCALGWRNFWRKSQFSRSPLPLSISLPSKSSHISLEWFLCLPILTLIRSLRCSSTSIIHQAGEGTTRLGLHQLSTCLPPGVAPGTKTITDRYIHTLAQIRPLHCKISCLALRHSAKSGKLIGAFISICDRGKTDLW